MGLGWIYLNHLNKVGVFSEGKAKILDIGCQNIYDVPAADGLRFVLQNGATKDLAYLTDAVRDLANRSPWARSLDGTSSVYFGELIALCGMEYIAYDIFPGERTRIFDLNFESAPAEHVGRFSCVLNYGTTEHVFNQYNSFKVIHDVTEVGGYMVHQVPTVGYINHGYWTYNPKTLLEMAAANRYEVKSFWITGPQGTSNLKELTKAPELMWDNELPENSEAAWTNLPVPNGLINAIFRKVVDAPFRLGLDVSTSDAPPTDGIADQYRTT